MKEQEEASDSSLSEEERIELLERGHDPIDGGDRWYTVGIVAPDIGKDRSAHRRI